MHELVVIKKKKIKRRSWILSGEIRNVSKIKHIVTTTTIHGHQSTSYVENDLEP